MLEKLIVAIKIFKMRKMDYKEFVKTICNIYKNEYNLDYGVVESNKVTILYNEKSNNIEYNAGNLNEFLHRNNKSDIDKFIYDTLQVVINKCVLAHQKVLENENTLEGVILKSTSKSNIFDRLLNDLYIEEIYDRYIVASNYSPYNRLANIKTSDILRSIELDSRYTRIYNDAYKNNIFSKYDELNKKYITESVSPTNEFLLLMGLEENNFQTEDEIVLLDKAKYGLSLTKKEQKKINRF